MAAFSKSTCRCAALRFVLPAVSCLVLFAGSGVGQEPVVHRIDSAGLIRGGRSSLTVNGAQLKNPVKLWTPFGVFRPKEGHDPNADAAVIVEADIPADVVPGIYPVRMVTTTGCSPQAGLLVDSLPAFVPADTSESRATAPPLTLPCCFGGVLNPAKPRYYKLALASGQAVGIEVFARRLSSALDPALRITDPAGHEVAYCDDVAGFDGDAQVGFVAKSAGDYLVELRDVKFAGGATHFFHLRLGNFPLITATSPRIASPASPVGLISPEGKVLGEVSIRPDEPAPGLDSPLVWRSAEHDSDGIVSVLRTHGAAQSETEPNDVREQALAVAAGTRLLSGRFQEPGDVDWYRLQADAPTPLCVTAHTRYTGSPADVLLELWSADGKKIAEADDAGPLDAQLVTSLPGPGEFFLRVSDLAGTHGPQWTYDLELDAGAGRIEVSAPTDRLSVPRNGSASLLLTVRRVNFDAPLLVQVEGLPASLRTEPIWLGAKQTTAAFTLTSGDANAESHDDDSGELLVTVSAPDVPTAAAVPMLLAPRPTQYKPADPFRRARSRADFFTAVAPAAPIALTAEQTQIRIAQGATVTIPIKATRAADWTAPIDLALTVAADQLPPGIKVDGAQMAETTAVLTITAAADALPGKFTVFAQGTIKKDKETSVQPIAAIGVEVTVAEAAK